MRDDSLLHKRLYHGSWTASRAENRRICTNDKTQLAAALDRNVSHRAAVEATRAPAAPAQTIERAPARQHGIGFGI